MIFFRRVLPRGILRQRKVGSSHKKASNCESNEGVGIPTSGHANGEHVVIYVSELKCMSNHLTFLYMPMHLTNFDICQSNLLTYAQSAHLSMQGEASHS